MGTRHSTLAILLGLLGSALGCSSAVDDGDASDSATTAADANAVLEIHPLDIWGQPLPETEAKLTVSKNGKSVKTGRGTTDLFVRTPGTFTVHLEAPNHEPLDVTVDYDGSKNEDAANVEVPDTKRFGVALAHAKKDFGGHAIETHHVYLGLRHKWFSAEGRPARRGNDLKFLMDGEEAWSTVRADLVKAQKDVMVSTWWWESDFELVRSSEIGATQDQRWPNTILGTLESIPATKRVMIGEFLGQDSISGVLTDDSKIRAYAAQPNDNFEMMQEANPTTGQFRFDIPDFTFGARVRAMDPKAPDAFAVDGAVASDVPGHDVDLSQMPLHITDVVDLASIHQKFMVVDDSVAFIGGMNLRHVDWDSSQHQIYDWRREKFDAWDSSRTSVQNKTKKPDTTPRKDYMVRIAGPSAQDAADVFHERWEYLRSQGVKYSENSSGFDVERDVAPVAGGVQAQVTATLPQPFWEHAIAETWFNAVRNAEKYIYIEDQYFRVPMLYDAIAARMDEKPDLKLVVVTMGVGKLGPDCVQTYKSNEFFKNRYGADRYMLFTLKSFDADTKEIEAIDTHSKMLIVDDVFMSVGSANKNNRGIIYEAELNVAVADPIVGDWRKRIAKNMLGDGVDVDDIGAWIGAMQTEAAANDAAQAAKGQGDPPQGFVYPLDFPASSSCLMTSVGPDET